MLDERVHDQCDAIRQMAEIGSGLRPGGLDPPTWRNRSSPDLLEIDAHARARRRGLIESCSMRRTQPPESMSQLDHWRSFRSTTPRSMSSFWTSKAERPSGGREAAPLRRPHRAIDRHADGRRSSAPRHDVQSSWQALGLSIVTGGGDDAAQTEAMDRVGGCRPLAPTPSVRSLHRPPIAVLACPERSQSVTRPPGSRDERRAGSKGAARSISLASPSR